MSEAKQPSSKELLSLLRQARDAIVESQEHWGSIQHLTGNRRNQRRYHELLALLDTIILDTENSAKVWARDNQD